MRAGLNTLAGELASRSDYASDTLPRAINIGLIKAAAADSRVGPWDVSGKGATGRRMVAQAKVAIAAAVSVPGVQREPRTAGMSEVGDPDLYLTPRGHLRVIQGWSSGDRTNVRLSGDAAAMHAIAAARLGLVDTVRPFRRINPTWDSEEYEDTDAVDALGLRQVGLNADWSVSAYFLGPGTPNVTPGAAYLILNEDDRTWRLVRRWNADDDYSGLPAEYRADYADGNDAIIEYKRFPTAAAAADFVRAKRAPFLRQNPIPVAAMAAVRLALPYIISAVSAGLVSGMAGFNALPRAERRARLVSILNSKVAWAAGPATALPMRAAARSDAVIDALVDLLGSHGGQAVAAASAAGGAAATTATAGRAVAVAPAPLANPHESPEMLAMLRAEEEEYGPLANPRRNRDTSPSTEGVLALARLAERAGLPAVATWLTEEKERIARAPALVTRLLALGPAAPVEVVEAGHEEQSAAKRRVQAFAALAILRRAQADAAANHGVLPVLSEADRAALATWSGLGGLFRNCADLTAEQVSLLRADQQEYCRLSAERLQGKARGLTEAQLPQISLDLTFAFEGMIAQYFTPLTIAEGMAKRAAEVWDATNPMIRPLRILEPSAGSGRIVQGWRRAGVGAAQWTLVEWDKDQADLLNLVYGVAGADYTVFGGPLETYVSEYPPTFADNRVDLVIANPPYADRRAGSKKADPAYASVKENQNYFVLRSLDYLRPRGVTIQLVPWGILTDNRGEDARVRVELLKRAHFFGAVELPSDVFPGSAQNVVLLVLGKRPVPLTSVLEADKEIAEGRWLRRPAPDGPEGPHMGRIDESSKRYRGGTLRTGAFDYDKLVEYTSREPDANYFAEVPATPDEIQAAKTVRNDRLGISTADVVRIGELLGSRCILVRENRVQNADRARGLLAELRPDLTAYVARFGLPRKAKLPREYRPTASWYALVSAFNDDGSFSELIGDEVLGPVSSYKGDGSAADVVRFLSARKGFATQADIEAVLGAQIDVKALLLHPDVYWYPERGDMELCYMRGQEFLSGPCWARMEWAREQRDQGFPHEWAGRPRLTAGDLAALVARASAFADRLLAAIGPKPISEIDIGIRSEWLYDKVPGTDDELDAGLLLEWLAAKPGRYYPLQISSMRIVNGLLVVEGRSATDYDVQDVVGYYNRSEEIEKMSRSGKKSKGRRNNDDLANRLKADREKDQQFASFVRNHARAMELALRYNRDYRGFVPRKYDESPVDVARFNPEDERGNRVTVRPYIWASVRRAVERRGGIMALDVGLGKTFAAILTAAAMRESGKARRIMVAVPNSVGPNWISEISRIMPDYRVLPVGFTPKMLGGKLRSTSDDVATLTRKLSDFAAGLYEIAIVQHSTLARFGVSQERAAALLSDRITSSRAIADELVTLQDKATKIAELMQQIAALEGQRSEEARKEREKAQDTLDRLSGADVKKLTDRLDALREEMKGVPDRDALREEQERATTQRELDRIAAQLNAWDDIDELMRRIERKQAVSEATIRNEVNDAIALEAFIADRIPVPVVNGVSFDDLLVDLLIVDEAHQFKNLYGAATRYGRPMKYMGALDAEKVTAKCWDLLVKALAVREANDGTGVLLLTATPLKNSPLEAYSLTSYCTDDAWTRRGITGPESFIDRFCVGEPEPVLKVDGSFDYQLAVNKFTNLDELRGVFAEWVDVKAAMRRKDYERARQEGRDPGDNIVPLDLPADAEQTHMIPMTPLVSREYEVIRKKLSGNAESSVGTLCDKAKIGLTETEAALVSSGQVDTSLIEEIEAEEALPRAANPRSNRSAKKELGNEDEGGSGEKLKGGEVLEAMDQMTKLATDPGLMGLIDPDAPIPLKYLAVAEAIRASKSQNGDCAHIVFSDYNKTHSGLKAAVVQVAGVPSSRIKLVTGALSVGQRQQVVDGFNGTWDSKLNGGKGGYSVEPEYDVVIGNTPTMGEGLNLQQRACSIHHVTLPWEPASIQQRNGRGVRQGNRYELVTLHYYLTERSFDGYKLSLIKGKRSWMVGLLESAAKTTNNPGASMGGPCAILKALAADPEAAKKACDCLEAAGAVREIARRKAAALQDFAAYIGAMDSSRRAREEDTKRYYTESALVLRAKLERLNPGIFPFREWLDRVSEVRALVIAATGRVYLEGAWYLFGGESFKIEHIDLDKAILTLRPLGGWETQEISTADHRILSSEAAVIDAPSQKEQDAAAAESFPGIYSGDALKEIAPMVAASPALAAIFREKVKEGLRGGYQLRRLTAPTLVTVDGKVTPAAWPPDVYGRGVSGDVGEIMLPTGEDAERWLRAVKSLPREVRVMKRPRFEVAYEQWFGRTYPKDLRDEQAPS